MKAFKNHPFDVAMDDRWIHRMKDTNTLPDGSNLRAQIIEGTGLKQIENKPFASSQCRDIS
jgi:hypothetical protein